jgi:hypothetical protein
LWNGESLRGPRCDLAVYQLQPRLDLGLTPREVRRFERQWE